MLFKCRLFGAEPLFLCEIRTRGLGAKTIPKCFSDTIAKLLGQRISEIQLPPKLATISFLIAFPYKGIIISSVSFIKVLILKAVPSVFSVEVPSACEYRSAYNSLLE